MLRNPETTNTRSTWRERAVEVNTELGAKVAQLIQVDWKWYNERKDEIDARVMRILRG